MPDGHLGLLFPQGVKGLTFEQGSWNPMGMRGSYSPTLLLDNCFIGDENVLGTPGFMPRDRWQSALPFELRGAVPRRRPKACSTFSRNTSRSAAPPATLRTAPHGRDPHRHRIGAMAHLPRRRALAAQGHRQRGAVLDPCQAPRDRECGDHDGQGGADRGLERVLGRSPLARMFRDLRVQTLHENIDKTAATIGKYSPRPGVRHHRAALTIAPLEGAYRPLKRGSRFSANAARPSRRSSVPCRTAK